MSEYVLYTDGGARGNPGPAATGAFLFKETQLVDFWGEYIGANGTNNEAEYNALIQGLKLCSEHSVKHVECRLDSELVVKQIKGEYKVKEPRMQALHAQALQLIAQIGEVSFKHVPRAENKLADRMVNLLLDAVSK